MSTVKIFLDRNESMDEAQEALIKALSAPGEGTLHSEDFQQAAARDVCAKMIIEHELMWQKMQAQIARILDEELS